MDNELSGDWATGIARRLEHKFGGGWTGAKLRALEYYLKEFAKALKFQRFELYYIDAFAGSGTYVQKRSADPVQLRGSAQIALETPGFHRYFFIEKKPKHYRTLQELVAKYGCRAEVLLGDANDHLTAICREIVKRQNARAVLFLDPYGMQVAWETLTEVSRTEKIDVWYLFPLNGVMRQMAKDSRKLDEDKERSLDRVFGTRDWRDALYAMPPQRGLFGDEVEERHADNEAVIEWITQRLRLLFPVIEGPGRLRYSKDGNPVNGPLAHTLYFLMSNPSPKARSAARGISKGVLDRLRREGVIPD